MSSPDETRLSLPGPVSHIAASDGMKPEAQPSPPPSQAARSRTRRDVATKRSTNETESRRSRRADPDQLASLKKKRVQNNGVPLRAFHRTRRLHVAGYSRIPSAPPLLAGRHLPRARPTYPGPNTRRTRAATRTAATSQKQSRSSRPYPIDRVHARTGGRESPSVVS